MMTNDFTQTLTIAGTDSGGGAGITADLKTMQMRHVFATMVVVAVTAQNTLGVQDAFPMPTKMIDEQFASLAADLNIRACKTGMLADAEHVKAIVRNLKKYDFGPLTVDPVMIAKGGVPLLSEDAISVVRDELVPLADLVTPNLPEAEKLTGMTITTEDEMVTAGKKLQALGAKNVLVVDTHNTHGTGDTISACITAERAKGHTMEEAIRTGKAYVEATIRDGINVGHGHGPLNHWAKIKEDD